MEERETSPSAIYNPYFTGYVRASATIVKPEPLDRQELIMRIKGREARQRNVDLIIIGSHQPSLSSRYLGSNANAITRDAKISVLIVRADERETA